MQIVAPKLYSTYMVVVVFLDTPQISDSWGSSPACSVRWGKSPMYKDRLRIYPPSQRLATTTENLFPAGFQDLFSAYHYLISQGVAAKSITIAGDSAGGNMFQHVLYACGTLILHTAVSSYSNLYHLAVCHLDAVTRRRARPRCRPMGLRTLCPMTLSPCPPTKSALRNTSAISLLIALSPRPYLFHSMKLAKDVGGGRNG